MTREVVVDTETTGLDPRSGDRIVEIGCVELENHLPTGRTYQTYLDPEREMPEAATRVTGITGEMLSGQPLFADVAKAFLDFVGAAPLIFHNARFDLGFFDAEFERLGRPWTRANPIIDTMELARRKYPGARASLDDLCKRFGIDLSGRELHGAVIDAQLTAAVYLELNGGRQPGLTLIDTRRTGSGSGSRPPAKPRPQALATLLTPQEEARHRAFVAKLGGEAIWLRADPELKPKD